MLFHFPRGRMRDARKPGGIWLVSAFFMLFGAGCGSLLGRAGFPAELVYGWVVEDIPAGTSFNSFLLAVAGAMAGIAASAAFAVAWQTEQREDKTVRLAWAFWATCLITAVLRIALDTAANWNGWRTFGREYAAVSPAKGVLLCMAISAIAFLMGIAFHGSILPSKYDNDYSDGPFGGVADWRRNERAIAFAMIVALLLVSFTGLVVSF